MTKLDDVVSWLAKLELPPGERVPLGTVESDLDQAEERIGFKLPNSFRSWLTNTNGPCVGPGGIVGIGISRGLQDLESIYELYPNWRANRWVPVAGDGCGNYYVLISGEYDLVPVVFVDVIENADKPAFVVASNLYQFLVFLFRRDLGESRWPFDKNEVIGTDPKILELGIALPWDS